MPFIADCMAFRQPADAVYLAFTAAHGEQSISPGTAAPAQQHGACPHRVQMGQVAAEHGIGAGGVNDASFTSGGLNGVYRLLKSGQLDIHGVFAGQLGVYAGYCHVGQVADEGDDFLRLLSRKTAKPHSTVDLEAKTHSKSKYRLLIVEDDDEIRRYICQELGRDFHMQECRNGKEAFTYILKKTPDLIISDIMMPEMDGMTLCSKVKQNINTNHIPVILLTAKSREEDNLEGLSIGADAYITKPFSIEILRQSTFNLIKSRERLRNNFQGSQTQKERMQELEIESPDERLLDRIMKVINDNIANPELNVEMVAETVGISRVHLHRKLKELTNQSTRDLIRNLRLKQAATLLAKKRQSINEVAALTGFTNVAYFSTAFKELYGMTPTAYMEQNAASASSDTE